MEVIYKYPLEMVAEQILTLSRGAPILDIQTQGNQLCLWAKINKDHPEQERKIVVIGTGNPIKYKPPQYLSYISTVQIGEMVWHFYECYVA